MIYAIGGLIRFAKNPANFATTDYDRATKEALLEYMESFEPCSVAGYVDDCKTGEPILNETNVGYEDGEYMWSTQDIYHIRKYNAAVKPEFIKHVFGH